MECDEPSIRKRSLGALRKATKKKPKSPDLIGTMRLQRHTIQAILKDVTAPGLRMWFAILLAGVTMIIKDPI